MLSGNTNYSPTGFDVPWPSLFREVSVRTEDCSSGVESSSINKKIIIYINMLIRVLSMKLTLSGQFFKLLLIINS